MIRFRACKYQYCCCCGRIRRTGNCIVLYGVVVVQCSAVVFNVDPKKLPSFLILSFITSPTRYLLTPAICLHCRIFSTYSNVLYIFIELPENSNCTHLLNHSGRDSNLPRCPSTTFLSSRALAHEACSYSLLPIWAIGPIA